MREASWGGSQSEDAFCWAEARKEEGSRGQHRPLSLRRADLGRGEGRREEGIGRGREGGRWARVGGVLCDGERARTELERGGRSECDVVLVRGSGKKKKRFGSEKDKEERARSPG